MPTKIGMKTAPKSDWSNKSTGKKPIQRPHRCKPPKSEDIKRSNERQDQPNPDLRPEVVVPFEAQEMNSAGAEELSRGIGQAFCGLLPSS